jgi:periplasmic copper chaperone A
VAGQQGTGGFMKITAKQDMKLVGISSPVAGVSEVHEMSMDGGVMKMRALPDGLELPAGKTVELKPGGFHLMLMDLKHALPKDTMIPLSLTFKDKAGKDVKVEIKVPVSARAPAMGSAEQMDMHKH